MSRMGFTIIELLVSIGIFVMSSALMFGALFGATDVFRRGEAARQAGDEATAVLAALRADLARAVPVVMRDGAPAPESGWTYAAVRETSGTCVFSFVIENPDLVAVGADGSRARQIVAWFVSDAGTPSDSSDDQLKRAVYAWRPSDGGERSLAKSPAASDGDIVTTGCLHFGVWMEVPLAHRLVTTGLVGPEIGWEASHIPPYAPIPSGDPGYFDSGELIDPPGLGSPFYPQADAAKFSLVLTGGGRFATRGTLIDANGTDNWRISGIKALPTITGSLLRIGSEWIRYNDYRKGVLSGVQSAQLRSQPGTRTRGETVLAGLPFSLVVALPR